MHIANMNIRITLQKNELIVDDIGNHMNKWVDYYSCYASAYTKSMSESDDVGQTLVQESVEFSIRYSSEVADITADKFRIVFMGKVYNISSIEDMGFKHKSLKLYAQREKEK